jgi:hypothetical protein
LTLVRSARILALAIVIGWSLAQAWYRVTDWTLSDMDAYWNAAMRIRAGEPVFPALSDESAADVYRYSPWFAALWTPLTFLPKSIVATGWSVILLLATASAVSIFRGAGTTSVAAMCFFGSLLIWGSSIGNVQPLMIAAIAHTHRRGSGPIVIGIAASLKAVPILFVIPYLRARQWKRAALSLAIAIALVAPMGLVDLSHYPGAGDAPSPLYALSPPAWAIGAFAAATLAFFVGRRLTYLASSIAVLALLPRITLFDITYLLPGATRHVPDTPTKVPQKAVRQTH